MDKFCRICGNIIKKPKYRISKNTRNRMTCCSKECRNKVIIETNKKIIRKKGPENWKYKKELHFCPVCGKEKNIPDGRMCKSCLTKTFRGENHTNYKDGSSLLGRKYNYDYKKWRMGVFRRDWFKCKECGYKGKELECHHIKNRKDYLEIRYDISNGITLCKKCHRKTRYKEELFAERFIKLI